MTKPLILFAHGAGVRSTSPWMRSYATRLEPHGRVVTFDYPYMREGRRRPDPAPRLIAAHRDALASASEGHAGPVVLAGKSMGSRIGCHLSLVVPVAALVCFGYPLVSLGKRGTVRDEVLRALETPILFVQGTRDRLCPLDHLDRVRARMKADTELHVVESGDHSLTIGKRFAREHETTQDAVDAEVARVVGEFIRRHATV